MSVVPRVLFVMRANVYVQVCVWFLVRGFGYPVCEWCVVCLSVNMHVCVVCKCVRLCGVFGLLCGQLVVFRICLVNCSAAKETCCNAMVTEKKI